MQDDLGTAYRTGPPKRVVSLVPSLTEAVAVTTPKLLVGATEYCTHPAGLDVARVGGSKYPSVEAVLALQPDLVLANVEENLRRDVDLLRLAGVPVWVTYPHTVPGALDSLRRLLVALGLGEPAWLTEADRVWTPGPPPGPGTTAVIPVWRRPWVVLGRDTFAGDMLARLGVVNLFDAADERYPRPSREQILDRKPELIVLPDEPYEFTDSDGPEAFPGIRYALVSGRHLTWYGPSLVAAREVLTAALAAATLGNPGAW
jgi:ABC-type Fe3+-hydroxamate transport system substrate-binding protein